MQQQLALIKCCLKLCVTFASVLTVQIQDNVDECLNMPCQAAKKPGSGNQNEVCPRSLICCQSGCCCRQPYVCSAIFCASHTGFIDTVAVKTRSKDPRQYTCSLLVTMCIPGTQYNVYLSLRPSLLERVPLCVVLLYCTLAVAMFPDCIAGS